MNFSDTLTVVVADARCVEITTGTDPNDYTCNLGIFGDGETANLDFDVRGTTLGTQTVTASVSGSSSAADTDSDSLAINVVASADLSLDKALASTDTTPAAGSTVSYTFTVHNDGPDPATGVTVVDTWPGPLGTPTIVAVGDATGGLNASDELVLQFGTVAAGATETVTVTAVVDAGTAPDTTIENVATVSGDQADPDATQPGDRRDSVTVITTA